MPSSGISFFSPTEALVSSSSDGEAGMVLSFWTFWLCNEWIWRIEDDAIRKSMHLQLNNDKYQTLRTRILIAIEGLRFVNLRIVNDIRPVKSH